MNAQKQASSKFFILPVDAQNMDTDISTGDADTLSFEKILKKLIVHGGELLSVSDWSFYYIDVTGSRIRYLMRDRLLHILTDSRLKASPLIKMLKKKLSSTELEKKPFIAYSLVSQSLPEHIFHNVDTAPMSVEEFIEVLVNFAVDQNVIEMHECREVDKPKEKESIYRLFYGSVLDALEILKVKYSYGEAGGEPCIVIDRNKNVGMIVFRPTNQ